MSDDIAAKLESLKNLKGEMASWKKQEMAKKSKKKKPQEPKPEPDGDEEDKTEETDDGTNDDSVLRQLIAKLVK